MVLKDTAQPFYIELYHKPDVHHPDDPVYDVLQDLMTAGRTSRLYRSLVRDKKIAAGAAGFNGFPGEKYPNMFAFFGVSTPGHTPAEIRDAIRAEIERIKTEEVDDAELAMVKTRAKANLIRRLDSNQGLAMQLGTAQARFGDWRELFRAVDRIDSVTKADVRRVANATFVESNRTVGIIESTRLAVGARRPTSTGHSPRTARSRRWTSRSPAPGRRRCHRSLRHRSRRRVSTGGGRGTAAPRLSPHHCWPLGGPGPSGVQASGFRRGLSAEPVALAWVRR